MKRRTVLMLYGGESSEHEVSIRSARNVYAAIDKDRYAIRLGYIDTEGRWWLLDDWSDDPTSERSTQIVVAPGTGTILTVPGSKVIPVDVIFPVLHGKLGEDGTVQGLAAMAHIPMVGCGVESSAICMDKDATKRLISAEELPVVPWTVIRKGMSGRDVIKQVKQVSKQGPWFVKPARSGSSVGVSKVTGIDGIDSAVRRAHEHDDVALVEATVSGRELEVAILGNPPHHNASGVGEIVVNGEFYDYDEKYASGSSSKTVLDAKLPKALTKVIRQHALDTYEALGCTGLARVDFLLSHDLVPYINEVNTLPGFTDISMYPKLWQAKGLSYPELIDRLIELAFE